MDFQSFTSFIKCFINVRRMYEKKLKLQTFRLGHKRNCSCTCLSSANSTAVTRNGLLKANLHGTKLSRTTFFSFFSCRKRVLRSGACDKESKVKPLVKATWAPGVKETSSWLTEITSSRLSTTSAQGNSVCRTKTDFRDDSLLMKHFKRLAFVCVYFSANVR